MKCRYFKNKAIWSSSTPKSGSCIWHKIRKCALHLQGGSRWQISNGKTADLWFDAWAADTGITLIFPSYSFLPNQKAASIRTGSTWTIPLDIPINVVEFLTMAVRNLSSNHHQEDTIFWKKHPTHALSFKEAWHVVRSRSMEVN